MYKENFVTYEHIENFMNHLPKKESSIFHHLEEYAINHHVPIIKKEVANYMKLHLLIQKPSHILEIGTAIGYSSIWMSNALGGNCLIDTLESDLQKVEIAKKNILDFGYQKQIRVWPGDAKETLQKMTPPYTYDFAFIDASKGHYRTFWDLLFPKMKSGSTIICDNIFIRGLVCLPEDSVPKKHQSQTRKMRDFVYYLCEEHRIETSIIPLGDGLSISYIY